MRHILFAILAMAVPRAAGAQSAAAPRVLEHDTWVYTDTIETRAAGWRQQRTESTVVRAGANSIVVSNKTVGSTMPPREQLAGADWSRVRSVNGHETVVNRPLVFPLSVGKTWQVDYTEDNPNRQHTSEHHANRYKVTGWEDVTVPAGTFRALKIESDGTWSAAIAPALSASSGARVDSHGTTSVIQTNRIGASVVTGRTYKAFWYVPEVKRWVKSLEEYYDANGVRYERYLDELESYQAAN